MTLNNPMQMTMDMMSMMMHMMQNSDGSIG